MLNRSYNTDYPGAPLCLSRHEEASPLQDLLNMFRHCVYAWGATSRACVNVRYRTFTQFDMYFTEMESSTQMEAVWHRLVVVT